MFQNKSYVSHKSQTEPFGITVNHNQDYVPTETWGDPHAGHKCSGGSLSTLLHVPEILYVHIFNSSHSINFHSQMQGF